MIGPRYWTAGITVRYHAGGGAWTAELEFWDDGNATHPARGGIPTEGELRTRYRVSHQDGIEAALTATIDTLKADAERLGIQFGTTGVGPTIYAYGDGEVPHEPMPADWRRLINAQAERLGWEPAYGPARRSS